MAYMYTVIMPFKCVNSLFDMQFEDGQCFGRINDRFGLFDKSLVTLRDRVVASPPITLTVVDSQADSFAGKP